MRKPHIAQFSDLSGPMNPAGIINAKYLTLKSALERGDHPDNVKQALFDWLSEKNFSQAQVEALLQQYPEQAIATIIKKLGAGLNQQALPQQVQDTLWRTLIQIGKDVRQRRGHGIASEIAGLRQMKQRYRAESLASTLLD